MNYKSYNLGHWISHINGVIEDETTLDGNEMRDLVEFLSGLPRWIPVSKRLPEENETVAASTDYGVYPEARYSKEDGWEWAYEAGSDYWVELKGVIAWMPLPEPYKAESEVRNGKRN